MHLKPTYEELEQRVKELESAEETLRKSEEKFKGPYEEAPVGYMQYDTERRITNINRTTLAMLGYSREEMIGYFVWEFVLEKEEARKSVLGKLCTNSRYGYRHRYE